MRARQHPTRSASGRGATVASAAIAGLLLLAGCSASGGAGEAAPSGGSTAGSTPGSDSGATSGATSEVMTFDDLSQTHRRGRVDYDQTPPVGGDHAPVWQNCGFYSEPIRTEQGVHSLEHGAVWITYGEDVPATEIIVLEKLTRSQPYLLVSPWDGDLPAPIVASAWGAQQHYQAADAPELGEFLETYLESSDSPEPGAPCTGGEGEPG